MNIHNKKYSKSLLKIPFYQQTLPTSCGAACLLMVGNFFQPQNFFLKKENEIEIHNKIKYWEGDENGEFGNVAKMIGFLRKNNFNIKYFLEISPNAFNPPPDFEEGLWKNYMNSFYENLNKEKENGLEVIDNCDMQLLINEILKGKPLIAEIQWNKYITHYVVIRGFSGNTFYIVDPLTGYQRMHKDWLKRIIDLGHGKNYFSLELKKLLEF